MWETGPSQEALGKDNIGGNKRGEGNPAAKKMAGGVHPRLLTKASPGGGARKYGRDQRGIGN